MHCCGDLSHDIVVNLHLIALAFLTVWAYLKRVLGRKMPWCEGCSDDLPDLCDDCWGEHHEQRDVVLPTKGEA